MGRVIKEAVERVKLKRGSAKFSLVGVAKVGEHTFKINEVSKNNVSYKYCSVSLPIETSTGNIIYTGAMGGFDSANPLPFKVNSKENYDEKFEIDWADRLDKKLLESINQSSLIKIGVEKYIDKKDGDKEKLFVKKFLTWYDASSYLQEHLTDGMRVTVSGDIKYSIYNDKIQCKKEIKSIYIARDTDENRASFTQSILLDKSSVSRLDPDSNEYTISAKVIDFTKKWGNKDITDKDKKGLNVPYPIEFVIKGSSEKVNESQTKKFLTKFFKVKKGITELIVEGDLVEGTLMSEVTPDDIPDEMRELIDMGVYSEEEILKTLTVKGDRVQKMVITRPYLKVEEKDGIKTVKYSIEEEKYKEEDLIFDFMFESEDDDAEEVKEEVKAKVAVDDDYEEDAVSGDDWLADLETEDEE